MNTIQRLTKPLPALCLTLLIPLLGACSEPDKPSVALYLAVQRGDIDQLELHIHWGTDINAMLPDGRYPLHVAADKGEIVMVKILLKHGADINQVTANGETALELAILSGRTQLAEVLLAQGARLDASSLLLKAAAAGITDRDSLRFLIEQGADTEQRNAEGDTPLLIAIRQDNHRLATHLVNRGADVNVKTADGRSALTLARELQLPELVSLLQRQGAL
jgi:ankyrin repeat protein